MSKMGKASHNSRKCPQKKKKKSKSKGKVNLATEDSNSDSGTSSNTSSSDSSDSDTSSSDSDGSLDIHMSKIKLREIPLDETIRKVLLSELKLIFPECFLHESSAIMSKQIVASI